jgi:TIR domain
VQVFLSHAATDEKYAGALRDHLTRLGLEVWNPQREILPGSNWLLEMGQALERADGVVFLFSKEAVRSRSARMEVEYAITQPKFEGKLVSVLLAPHLDIPWILRNLPLVNAAGRETAAVARQIAEKLGVNSAGPIAKTPKKRASNGA